MPNNIFTTNTKNMSNSTFLYQTTSKEAKILKFGMKNVKLATLSTTKRTRHFYDIEYGKHRPRNST